METRTLRYFLTVADVGSITQAAKLLHLTQPTLSRQLHSLEQELGVALLDRSKRQISLTPEGAYLQKRGHELVDFSDRIERVLRGRSSKIMQGDVTIGAGEGEEIRIVARCAAKLRETYPQIRFHLIAGDHAEVMERLENGALDVAIVPIGQTANAFEAYESIVLPYANIWGVLMRLDSSLAGRSSLIEKDLQGLPLIIPQEVFTARTPGATPSSIDGNYIIAGTYTLLFDASLFVEEGFGVAICFDKLIQNPEGRGLKFVPLETPPTSAAAIWKRHGNLSPAASLFIDELRTLVIEESLTHSTGTTLEGSSAAIIAPDT